MIKTLTCAVCGAETKGRQWANRDNGYGICDKCVDTVEAPPEFETKEDYLYFNFGKKGFHYGCTR